jgi:hypothetical protein
MSRLLLDLVHRSVSNTDPAAVLGYPCKQVCRDNDRTLLVRICGLAEWNGNEILCNLLVRSASTQKQEQVAENVYSLFSSAEDFIPVKHGRVFEDPVLCFASGRCCDIAAKSNHNFVEIQFSKLSVLLQKEQPGSVAYPRAILVTLLYVMQQRNMHGRVFEDPVLCFASGRCCDIAAKSNHNFVEIQIHISVLLQKEQPGSVAYPRAILVTLLYVMQQRNMEHCKVDPKCQAR